jgi:hypothetical protein
MSFIPFVSSSASNFQVNGVAEFKNSLSSIRNNNSTSPQIILQQSGSGDSLQNFVCSGQNFSIGIDYDDNKNVKMSLSSELKGTTYSDDNTVIRIHTETSSEGIIDFNHQSRFRAYLNNPFISTDSTWTQIPFDAERYDEKNEFDAGGAGLTPYSGTIREDGYYQINARYEYTDVANGGVNPSYGSIAIYVGGSSYSQGNSLGLQDSNTKTLTETPAFVVSDVIYLTAGSVVSIYAYSNGGTSYTIAAGSEKTYFSCHKIS